MRGDPTWKTHPNSSSCWFSRPSLSLCFEYKPGKLSVSDAQLPRVNSKLSEGREACKWSLIHQGLHSDRLQTILTAREASRAATTSVADVLVLLRSPSRRTSLEALSLLPPAPAGLARLVEVVEVPGTTLLEPRRDRARFHWNRRLLFIKI